jgi:hypothetical protein
MFFFCTSAKTFLCFLNLRGLSHKNKIILLQKDFSCLGQPIHFPFLLLYADCFIFFFFSIRNSKWPLEIGKKIVYSKEDFTFRLETGSTRQKSLAIMIGP